MTIQLPAAVTAYFAAKNSHDIDAMLAPFAAGATVLDEGEEHVGPAAIHAWMEQTTRKYRVTVEPLEVMEDDEVIAVVGLVSGDFPGSPARLRYSFTLSAAEITRLKIG